MVKKFSYSSLDKLFAIRFQKIYNKPCHSWDAYVSVSVMKLNV